MGMKKQCGRLITSSTSTIRFSREIYELLRAGRKYNQRNRLPATEFIEGVRDVWIDEYTPENSGRAMF